MFKFRNKYVKPRGSGCGCNRPRGSGVYTGGAGAAELQQVERALQRQEALRFPLTNATPELLAERQAVNQPISGGTPPFELPMIPQQEPGPSYTGPLRMTATANAAGGVQLTGAVPDFTLEDVLASVKKLLGHAHGYLDSLPAIDEQPGSKAHLLKSQIQLAIINAKAALGDAALGLEKYQGAGQAKRITDALLPELGRFMDRLPGAIERLARRAEAEGVEFGKVLAANDELADAWARIADHLPKPEKPGGLGLVLAALAAVLAVAAVVPSKRG